MLRTRSSQEVEIAPESDTGDTPWTGIPGRGRTLPAEGTKKKSRRGASDRELPADAKREGWILPVLCTGRQEVGVIAVCPHSSMVEHWRDKPEEKVRFLLRVLGEGNAGCCLHGSVRGSGNSCWPPRPSQSRGGCLPASGERPGRHRKMPSNGLVAHLGERTHGMREVVGSIPTRSTCSQPSGSALGCRDALQATRVGFDSLWVHSYLDGARCRESSACGENLQGDQHSRRNRPHSCVRLTRRVVVRSCSSKVEHALGKGEAWVQFPSGAHEPTDRRREN